MRGIYLYGLGGFELNCAWLSPNCNSVSTPQSPWSNSNLYWKWTICTLSSAFNFSCLQLNLLVSLQYQEHVNYTIIPHFLLVHLCSEGMFSKHGSYGIQQPCQCWIGGIGVGCAGGSSLRHLWGWLCHDRVALLAPMYFFNLLNGGAAASLPSWGFPAGSSGGSDLAT
jgi:hypothetical protein